MILNGIGSWYGPGFLGHQMADGGIYKGDQNWCAMVNTPLESRVNIYNPDTHRYSWCIVRDRGPYVGNRIIDVTEKIAKDLGYFKKGTAKLVLHIFVKEKTVTSMPIF
jgi:rare lipoprotein A